MGTLSMVVEMSNIFNNIRKLMMAHEMKDSKIFLINGLVFTFTFFVFRGMFFVWMIADRLYPAFVLRDNWAQADPLFARICIYTNVSCYAILCVLNFFWLFLITKGVYGLLVKKPRVKEEQEMQKF